MWIEEAMSMMAWGQGGCRAVSSQASVAERFCVGHVPVRRVWPIPVQVRGGWSSAHRAESL